MFATSGHGARYANRLDDLDTAWLSAAGCILWFRGKTATDFPIKPAVSITSSGTFETDTLNNGRTIVEFDGSTNYISIPDHSSISHGTADFTYVSWARFDVVNVYQVLWAQTNPSTHLQPIWFTLNDEGKLATLFSADGSAYLNLSNYVWSTTVVASAWNFIVLRRSTTSVIGILNGTQNFSYTIGSSGLYDLGNDAHIGYRDATYPQQMNGNIKDFMIFNVSLSDGKIDLIYNATKKYLVK